jgi:23S rRNA pseudouridine1911/1915/1917 synthase
LSARSGEGDCRRSWRADRGDAAGRLDRALVRHFAGLPEISRSQVQGWIGAGRVRVNGAVVTRPAGRLAAGDAVEVELPAPPPPRRGTRPLVAQPLPLAILFEDEHLLAVDKPAGLVVHPTGRYRDGTLVNALVWHFQTGAAVASHPAGDTLDSAAICPSAAAAAGGAGPPGAVAPAAAAENPPVRPGLVHRLDRGTSGVLLVAKSRAAHAGLARAIKARALQKDYLAVAYGRAPLRKGRIELKLLRDPHDRRRVVASRAEGQGAATLYELLAESFIAPAAASPAPAAVGPESAGPGVDRAAAGPAAGPAAGGAGCGDAGAWLSLLRCRLVTGRTHQIRVHLSALGLPIVGDPLYGQPRHRGIADPALAVLCRDFPRQALHAWRLALRHPVTGGPLELLAPLPADLRQLLLMAGLAEAPPAWRVAW